jgi:hypothetical protein
MWPTERLRTYGVPVSEDDWLVVEETLARMHAETMRIHAETMRIEEEAAEMRKKAIALHREATRMHRRRALTVSDGGGKPGRKPKTRKLRIVRGGKEG